MYVLCHTWFSSLYSKVGIIITVPLILIFFIFIRKWSTVLGNAASQCEKPDSNWDSQTLTTVLYDLPHCFVWLGTRTWEVWEELAVREGWRGNAGFVMVRSILFHICLSCSEIALAALSISLFSLFPHLQKSVQGLMESLGFSLWNIHGPLAVSSMLTFSSIRKETSKRKERKQVQKMCGLVGVAGA